MSKREKAGRELVLEGIPISEGVAIGKLFFLEAFPDHPIPQFPISATEIEKEIFRYRHAITSSRKDLTCLHRFLAQDGDGNSATAVSVIDAHLELLSDPFMNNLVEKNIRQMMQNTEAVFRSVMAQLKKRFKDVFFKERLMDLKDLSQRIEYHLRPKTSRVIESIPKNSILFSKELVPSKAAEASRKQVRGFITEIGGTVSHAALIARSKRIPYVSNISVDVLAEHKDAEVIIDGSSGQVIINPLKKTLKRYQLRKTKVYPVPQVSDEKENRETTTLDGCRVELFANIASLDDLKLLSICGAEGIGLFRTEFLFFNRDLHSFSEEEQYLLYKQVVSRASGLPVVLRAFDIGGDKGNVNGSSSTSHSALGCRAIRYLLRHPKLFALQLRAFLRVSTEGKVSILLPFISDVSELIRARQIIAEVASELCMQGYEIAEHIPIGSMIEVPSAVIMCDTMGRESDFLSIGTNDLIQYTLAVDRQTKEVYPYCRLIHPSIVRMLCHIVQEANKQNIPVSLCGEMASDPLMIPLLLGLGIRKFSCVPLCLPSIKKMVTQLSLKEVVSFVDEVLSLETAMEIETLLRRRYEEMVIAISAST